MSSEELLRRCRLRNMQIITAALTFGIVVFFGIAIFLVLGPGGMQPAAQNAQRFAVSTAAGVMLATTGALSYLLPGVMTQNQLKQIAADSGPNDIARLLGVKQATLVVGLALLEGPAFTGLVAFIIERQPVVLVVPALALVAMLLRFPTEGSVRDWLETNGRRVLELRQDRPTV